MIDYHCHLDLYKNPISVFNEVKKRKTDVFAVTTSPKAYLKTSQYFGGAENVRVALGFHPELVVQRYTERQLFFEHLSKCKYIGEIGIDGKNRNEISIQKGLFIDILKEAEKYNGRIMSIHSRGAIKDVLTSIESEVQKSIPVLHWFTGTKKELEWALSIGCWFSINPRMCQTKSGREIISLIPLSKIVPETDAPFTMKNSIPYMPWDTTVVDYLSELNGITQFEIERIMGQNIKSIEQDG